MKITKNFNLLNLAVFTWKLNAVKDVEIKNEEL
jgi:hypothetical protein